MCRLCHEVASVALASASFQLQPRAGIRKADFVAFSIAVVAPSAVQIYFLFDLSEEWKRVDLGLVAGL